MLASETVEAIFARLLVRYGSAWSAKWAGIPPDVLKQDWQRVLGAMTKERLLYGLEQLPEFVPTVHQFREACLRMPEAVAPSLPSPRQPMPDRVAQELAKIGSAARRDPKAWAYALRDAEQQNGGVFEGQQMTEFQRSAWRNALDLHDDVANDDEAERERTADLKARSARSVAEYAKRNGIDLDDEPPATSRAHATTGADR